MIRGKSPAQIADFLINLDQESYVQKSLRISKISYNPAYQHRLTADKRENQKFSQICFASFFYPQNVRRNAHFGAQNIKGRI